MQYTIDGLDSQVHDVLFDNIPTQLKIHRQFVLWKSEERDGKLTKIPYNANLSGNASTTDPSHGPISSQPKADTLAITNPNNSPG